LPTLASATDIARAIGITEQELGRLAYHRQSATVDHYHRFTIPKRRGGERVISSPKKRLRAAQSWILQSILTPVEIHSAATAFRPGLSIVDNSARHAGKAIVLRIDLKDFFPSIGFGRVKNMFNALGYNEGVATILALLSTEAPRVAATLDRERRFIAIGGRCLPQGACTSPAITNILCRRMDARLTGAAQRHGFTYSRYADDLIFSSDNKDAPVGALLGLVKRIIKAERFTINVDKTLVMRPQHRQAVTGLVVNGTPCISRQDIRRFRAFLHQYEKLGREEMTKRLGQDSLAYAAGYLSFIHMVNPEQEMTIRAAHPWLERRQRADS
jgi:retron-type reverse transcriptase